MFNILIADDDEPTRQQLEKYLADILPGVAIETAGAVDPAIQCVEMAYSRGAPFDAAILDFKLPIDQGGNPEPDHTICDRIHELMPETFVVHITAFGDDPEVLKHILESHRSRYDPWGDYVPKNKSDYAQRLGTILKNWLYGKPIEDAMDMLFGRVAERAAFPSAPMDMRRGGSLTHELAALTRNIESHWNDLDDRLKKRIAQVFHVNEDVTPIRVSVLRDVRSSRGE